MNDAGHTRPGSRRYAIHRVCFSDIASTGGMQRSLREAPSLLTETAATPLQAPPFRWVSRCGLPDAKLERQARSSEADTKRINRIGHSGRQRCQAPRSGFSYKVRACLWLCSLGIGPLRGILEPGVLNARRSLLGAALCLKAALLAKNETENQGDRGNRERSVPEIT